jgi:hypothetical protein
VVVVRIARNTKGMDDIYTLGWDVVVHCQRLSSWVFVVMFYFYCVI